AATMKRIREELSRIQKLAEADENARRAAEAEREKAAALAREKFVKSETDGKVDKDKGAQLLKDFQDLQKGKELLQRFPPEKYGPQTLKELADMALRKQPVPLEMREFADPEVQRLWNLALNVSKEAATSEKKEKDKEKEEKK